MPDDVTVQSLHRGERGPHRASGHRTGARHRVSQVDVAKDDRFWFNLAYTYNDFFFDADARYGNNDLPGVPPHYVRAEVLYKHPSGFYAGPNVEWMPQEFFSDNANSLTIDPYSLWNFKIGYESGSGWSGYLEGRNLFDKRYISTTIIAETAAAASALFNPGYGRAVYGGFRYRQ